MDLNATRIDIDKQEQGDWVGDLPGMGELRLKVRGSNNKDWRRMQTILVNSIPRARRIRGLSPEDADAISCKLLRDCGLLDWEGPTKEDGTPLPFSKEQAYIFLCNPKNGFLEAALTAANSVAEVAADDLEDDAKN